MSAKYQGYSLTFWPKSLIFITFQSFIAIKINQFQFALTFHSAIQSISILSAKYQGYSLTFCHFHHFSICNQNQSISILIICPKYQGYSLTFWPKIAHFHHFSNLQSKSINFNFVICRQNTKVIALLFGQKSLIFITFQSAININQFQFCHLSAKYQGYSLTFWPKSLIFITFQFAIKINQFQFLSFVAKYQGYSLTFWPKIAYFHHFSFAKNRSSKSINFNFCHLSAKYQGYSLSHFCPKSLIFITFNHLSFVAILTPINHCQSNSILIICRQNSKVIALHFGQ